MLGENNGFIEKADRAAARNDFDEAWSCLGKLSLGDFGTLLLDVPDHAQALKKWLPSMPSDEVQRNWTGASGEGLLQQSCDFVHAVESHYSKYTGQAINTANILDYGCGWGRLIRLMAHHTHPRHLYGVDPWDESIRLCLDHNCPGNFALCDYVPDSLPFDMEFDLIYAFSVFTHLSEKTTDAVLNTLHRYLSPGGLLVITIRPEEYWDVNTIWSKGYSSEKLKQDHLEKGFAFMPHNRPPIDGDITYGDTSMTLDYIGKRWPQWKVTGTTANQSDAYQTIVFMQKS